MDMDLNNRLTEDETLEQAYDIFLELAADNLDPADILLFNLQFEERGGAELFDPAEDWQEHVDFDLNPDFLLKWSLVWRTVKMAKLTIFSPAFCCVAKKITNSVISSGESNLCLRMVALSTPSGFPGLYFSVISEFPHIRQYLASSA